ncbi:MAG: DUF4342 domain-containing protein [Bacillota bacterium]|nr:DUF4342 domain-containing protein [Bacillota bacterium]
MKYSMEAIDEVRKRTGVGYEAAKEALDLTGGDVLDAIIYLERKGSIDKNIVKSTVEKFKNLVNEGFISQIQVFKNGQKIFDIPVVAGVAMMALWTVPFTAALVFAIASKCDIRIIKRDGAAFNISEVTIDKFNELFAVMKQEVSKAKEKFSKKSCDACQDADDDFRDDDLMHFDEFEEEEDTEKTCCRHHHDDKAE